MQTNKLISFDLQGTLSDSAFSDEFWLTLLPALYAQRHNLSEDAARTILEQDFKAIGKYHALFYNHRLRLDEVLPSWTFSEVIKQLQNKPKLDLDVLNIVNSLPRKIPKIIFSATTHDFIDIELGSQKQSFNHIFSAIDDFETPGKPPELFVQIANELGVRPANCIHIGDCHEMDVTNADKAGWASFHFNRKRAKHEIVHELRFVLDAFLST